MFEAMAAEPNERLREARIKAGYPSAAAASRAFGWGSTYASHENGSRGILPDTAERYAKAFRVPAEWILFAKGRKTETPPEPPKTVPLVGKVAAGARMYFSDAVAGDDTDTVAAPSVATDTTVAVEVDGDSLGPAFNGWLVFYDDVHRPVRQDLIGELCVVGLDDGRVMIKILRKARAAGTFHLLPNGTSEPPILDVKVAWAAKVRSMRARR
jgi:SOS-response transcriptional repressor LexA